MRCSPYGEPVEKKKEQNGVPEERKHHAAMRIKRRLVDRAGLRSGPAAGAGPRRRILGRIRIRERTSRIRLRSPGGLKCLSGRSLQTETSAKKSQIRSSKCSKRERLPGRSPGT